MEIQGRRLMSNNRATSSDSDSSGKIFKSIKIECRFDYIRRIVEKLELTKKLLPEPNEEQLYKDALGHLVDVLSTTISPVLDEGYWHRCKYDWCTKQGLNKKKRAEKLQEILNKLKYLERRRFYDPPSDNEIGYYHLIKKYIRSMGIFFTSQKGIAEDMNERFDCVTSMIELHYLEELEEGNRHLEQFSSDLRDMNVINGCDVKHFCGVNEVPVQPVIICGSKERNNLFYHHKFRLALFDLVSSHCAFIQPYPEERECYEQILNLTNIVPPPQSTKEVSVYSDHLWYQFFVKVAGNITNFEKQCAHVGNVILAKLSIPASWEKLASLCVDEDEDEVEGLIRFINETVEKCNLASTQLDDVDRFIKIAHYIREFLRCHREITAHVSPHMHIAHRPNDPSDPDAVNLDWQALHAFTFFKNGSSFPVNELAEKQEMLRDGLEPCSKKKRTSYLNGKHASALSDRKEEDENASVAMLKAILDEIRMIGDWHLEPLPTCTEDYILLNISLRLTSSTHFFLSATAYEQRTRVVQHGYPNVRRTARKRKREDLDRFISFPCVVRRWEAFISMLEGYKGALLETLNNSQEF